MKTFTLRVEDGELQIKEGIFLRKFDTPFGTRFGIPLNTGKAIEVLNGNLGMVNHIFPTKMTGIYSTIPLDDESCINPHDIMVRIPNQTPWGPEAYCYPINPLCHGTMDYLFILNRNQEIEVTWKDTLRVRFTTSRRNGIYVVNKTKLNEEEEYW